MTLHLLTPSEVSQHSSLTVIDLFMALLSFNHLNSHLRLNYISCSRRRKKMKMRKRIWFWSLVQGANKNMQMNSMLMRINRNYVTEIK